jgi:hypothetical protein
LIEELVSGHCVVHSLAIGPRTDCEFLATLANHTGGRVFVRQNISGITLQQMGSELAKVISRPVFWPSETSWPVGITAHYPTRVPPMRLDRDSILIGTLQGESVQGSLKIDGEVQGRSASISWNLKSESSNPDLAFVGAMVSKAAKDGGLLMPTPGSDALRELGDTLMSNADQLVKEAKFALHMGDNLAASAIAKEALQRSPNNLEARSVLDAALSVNRDESSASEKQPAKLQPAKNNGAAPKIAKFISARFQDDPFGQPPTEPNPPASDDPFGEPAGNEPVPEVEGMRSAVTTQFLSLRWNRSQPHLRLGLRAYLPIRSLQHQHLFRRTALLRHLRRMTRSVSWLPLEISFRKMRKCGVFLLRPLSDK